MGGTPVIKLTVLELGDDGESARGKITLGVDAEDRMPRLVVFRNSHYCTPVASTYQKYGVDFGERSVPPRPVKIGDVVLIRRHCHRHGLAWQWCFENDTAVGAPAAKAEERPVTKLVLVEPKTPKLMGTPEILQNEVKGKGRYRWKQQVERLAQTGGRLLDYGPAHKEVDMTPSEADNGQAEAAG